MPDSPHLMPGTDPNWPLGYGYQWWIPESPDGDYLAIGIYGQAIYMNPRYNIVIAKTSAYADYNLDGEDMEIENIGILLFNCPGYLIIKKLMINQLCRKFLLHREM
jgi:CubicO group peptidase (beta-lactamase class C family)